LVVCFCLGRVNGRGQAKRQASSAGSLTEFRDLDEINPAVVHLDPAVEIVIKRSGSFGGRLLLMLMKS
jgi:hypothetical protein